MNKVVAVIFKKSCVGEESRRKLQVQTNDVRDADVTVYFHLYTMFSSVFDDALKNAGKVSVNLKALICM